VTFFLYGGQDLVYISSIGLSNCFVYVHNVTTDIYVTHVIGSIVKTKHRAVVIRPSHDYMRLRRSYSKRKKLSCMTCDSII